MTVLILVLILLLVIVVPALSWARSRRRDEKSIQAHRSTLGVIEHVAGADAQPARDHDQVTAHVRIVGQPAAAPRSAQEEVVRPERPRSPRPSFPRPRETRLEPPGVPEPAVAGYQQTPGPVLITREIARQLADRVRTAQSSGPALAEETTPGQATPQAERRAAGTPRRFRPPRARKASRPVRSRGIASRRARSRPPRSRPGRPTAGPHLLVVLGSVAAVLVMAAITGIALSSHHGTPPHRRPTAASPRQTGPVPNVSGASSTTLPPPAVVATSTSTAYAAYTVNATNLDVNLVAARSCWVELREGTASGPVVFEGTLQPGVSQIFHAVGAIWLRLGNPAGVKLAIDGAPVGLPTAPDPFDVMVTGPAGA